MNTINILLKSDETEAKPGTFEVRKAEAIKKHRIKDGMIDLSRCNMHIKQAAFSFYGQRLGHITARQMKNVYPLTFLIEELVEYTDSFTGYETYDELKELHDNGGTPGDEVDELFIDLYKLRQEANAEMEAAQASGFLEFRALEAYFKEGMVVVWDAGGDLSAGTVQNAQIHRSFFGSYLEVQVQTISCLSTQPQMARESQYLGAYRGTKRIEELEVRAPTDEELAKLVERGRAIIDTIGEDGRGYVGYFGQITQLSWWGSRDYRADGRLMIDAGMWSRTNSNSYQEATRALNIQFSNESGGRRRKGMSGQSGIDIKQLTDAQLATVSPLLGGFSMRAKQWGVVHWSGVRPIEWKADAFDRLVMDDKKKEMIRALVTHHGQGFTDLIDGKGGGCIFLLHGVPGQGKTLTAEVTAELLKRPLYSVSVGELGTDPDKLEDRLRTILDTATEWNAVILLDEADIFLEARNETDVLRNAMVGVFLRLLEYHQGVLFLTTNRVKNIDPAFYSRVSMALAYGEGDAHKRMQVWRQLADASGLKLDDGDVRKLARHTLNGRQIKNVIRLTQTLASSVGKEVDLAMLDDMIGETTAFERDFH